MLQLLLYLSKPSLNHLYFELNNEFKTTMVYFSEYPSIQKLSLSVFPVTGILFSSSVVCYLHDRVERND